MMTFRTERNFIKMRPYVVWSGRFDGLKEMTELFWKETVWNMIVQVTGDRNLLHIVDLILFYYKEINSSLMSMASRCINLPKVKNLQ